MRTIPFRFFLVFAPALLFYNSAMAQLEEVIVTAERVETNVQSTPISIIAFSGEKLEELGINESQEMDNFLPNVQIDTGTLTGGTGASFSIRGIGNFRSFDAGQLTTAVYIDDVFMPGYVGNMLDVMDLERVEVLRGPQGTLFGRNAVAGAIHYISRRPDTEAFTGRAKLTGSDLGRANVDLGLNIPLSDRTAARIAFSSTSVDGYIQQRWDGREVGGRDSTAFRGSLMFEATDNLTFDVIVDQLNAEVDGHLATMNLGLNVVGNATAGNWLLANPRTEWRAFVGSGLGTFDIDPNSPTFQTVTGNTAGICASTGQPAPCSFTFNLDDGSNLYSTLGGNVGRSSDLDTGGLALKATWDVTDNATLKFVTGFRNVDSEVNTDTDGTPILIRSDNTTVEQESVSQEIQLTWSGDRVSFVGGLYYYDEDFYEVGTRLGVGYANFDTNCTLGFGMGAYSFNGCTIDQYTGNGPGAPQITDVTNESVAVYANVNIPLNDTYELILGGRYTDDEQNLAVVARDGSTLSGLGGTQFTESVFTPRVVLNAQWTDNVFGYASFSEGYRQGGINDDQAEDAQGNLLPMLVPPFDSETNAAWEFGIKSDLLDGRARLNAAYYFYDYENLQTAAISPTGGGVVFEQNAANVDISGIEIDFSALLGDYWQFNAAVGTNDAEYKELTVGGSSATQIALESPLPRAPELSYSLGLIFDRQMPSGGNLFASMNYGYTDEQLSTSQDYNNLPTLPGNHQFGANCDQVVPSLNRTDACNGNAGILPDYGIVNARVQWTNPADTWTVGLFCRNCTDEYYLFGLSNFSGTQPVPQGPLWNHKTPGRPREVGLDFEYRFGN